MWTNRFSGIGLGNFLQVTVFYLHDFFILFALQEGSSAQLYQSVHSQLFTLPDECLVFPAHDYKGNCNSSIGEEKQFNPRLRLEKTQVEFEAIMMGLNLPRPARTRSFCLPVVYLPLDVVVKFEYICICEHVFVLNPEIDVAVPANLKCGSDIDP